MIELGDHTRGIWYVEFGEANWMGVLSEVDGKFVLTQRFRYVLDDKIFDSDDVKNWYQNVADTLEQAITGVRAMTHAMQVKAGGKVYELLRGTGTLEQFVEQLQAMPFVHSKTFKSEAEARAAGVIK